MTDIAINEMESTIIEESRKRAAGPIELAVTDEDLDTMEHLQKFFELKPVITQGNWSDLIMKLAGSNLEKVISVAEGVVVDASIHCLPTYGFLSGMRMEKSGSEMTLMRGSEVVSGNEAKAVVAYFHQRRHHPMAIVASEGSFLLLPKTRTIGEYTYSLGSRRKLAGMDVELDFSYGLLAAMSRVSKNTTKKAIAISGASWMTGLSDQNRADQMAAMVTALQATVKGPLEDAMSVNHSIFDSAGAAVLTSILAARYATASVGDILLAAKTLNTNLEKVTFLEQTAMIFLPVSLKTPGLVDSFGNIVKSVKLSTCSPESAVVLNPKPASGQQILQFSATDVDVFIEPADGFFKKTGSKNKSSLIPWNYSSEKVLSLRALKDLLKPKIANRLPEVVSMVEPKPESKNKFFDMFNDA